MQGPVQISFKDVIKTPGLEVLIHRKINKLEKICDHIISCRLTIERPQKYPDTGNPYRIRIDLTVPPGHEIVAKQSSSEGNMHDPLEKVIKQTFNAAERQLKELTEKQHREVKTHPQQQVMGIIHKLFADRGFGFIKTVDTQQEIYFHRNSVLHEDFDRLAVGTGVRFVAEQANKGLQASTVEIIYKA